MLHRVGHFTAKNVPGGWGISSHDNVENPCPPLFPEVGGVGVTIDCCITPGSTGSAFFRLEDFLEDSKREQDLNMDRRSHEYSNVDRSKLSNCIMIASYLQVFPLHCSKRSKLHHKYYEIK